MSTFKAVACGFAAVAGLVCGADAAEAGSKGFHGGFGHSNHHHHHGGFGHSHHHHGGGVIIGRPFVPIHRHRWHDTSHFDYHGGGYVWNGFRWVYVPGHLHWHRDGHWHHH